jgi:hypothetical protein
MKIDASILKSVCPDRTRLTIKQISNLGLDCLYDDDYCITDTNMFINNFWCKLTEQQKASLFLAQLVKYDNTINDLENSIRSIENRLDNLKITYNY